MKQEILRAEDYQFFIKTIKTQICGAQIKAAVAVNIELLRLYWFLGQWYQFWKQEDPIGQQLVAQLEMPSKFAGKLNFYISAIDDLLATAQDKPTIGILICKSKDKTIVEYSLKDIQKPMGVSEYELVQHLPEQLKSSLPTIEAIEEELGGFCDE